MPEITAVSEHPVDIFELVRRTKERLRSYRDNQDHHEKKELICRVPKKYHEIDGSDYVPRRWSIGPYHNGDERLENMEIYKLSSLNYICEHFPATLEKFYEELQSLEIEARRYYSGDINMDTPSFLQMLLLDSCFIIDTVILKVWNKPADSIFNSSNTGSNSMRNNAENHGAQNSNQRNPGFAGNENSDQNNIQVSREQSDEYNIQVSGEGPDEYNLVDPILNSSNTGSNSMRNNGENHGAQNSKQSNPGFAGNETSDQNNIQVSRERSDEYNPSDEYNIQVSGEGPDEYNPADPILNSSNTGSNSMRNNGENHGAQNSNQSNPGFAGNENSDQNNIQVSRERSDEYNPSDEYNIQVSGEGSDEYNPANPILNSSNTGSNSMRNNGENHGAQNSNQSNPGFAGNENLDQYNIQVSREGSDKYNPSAIRPSIFNDVLHDLLLFENQIPFFILQRMYNIATGDETPNERVACQLGIMLMVFIQDISITTMEYEPPPKKIHHLLHLFHWWLRPSEKQNDHSQIGTSWLIKRLRLWCQPIRNQLADLQWKRQTDNNQQQKQYRRWRRAVEYHEAGVHFKLPQKLSHSPLDIKFENGELRIPKLIIDEKTSFIFGNLLAFEQETAQFRDFFITTYITFMSQLLSKPEDVMLLSQKGIIENHLGCNEDVSELFNNLTKFRFLELGSRGYLKPVCCALEKHYENSWNHWFAWLRHRHMTNPWLILSLVAAAVVAISAMVDPWLIPYVRRKYHQG